MKSNMDFYELYCEQVLINERLMAENKDLKDQLKRLNNLNINMSNEIRYLREHQEEIIAREVKKQTDLITQKFEEKVILLEKEVAHLKSILNNDSTNSSIPTSQTPINKSKKIYNSRKQTSLPKGGQKGHEKHTLIPLSADEITKYIDHRVDICPSCHAHMIDTDNIRIKDEIDFEIVVHKIRHRFIETKCPECGHVEKIKIPDSLKEANQYGTGVQSLALTLMNEGYVSMNRTKSIIEGLTKGEISPSEGYISKLQKRLYSKLEDFDHEMKRKIIGLDVLHWDDTVIYVSTNRACLRFYGDSQLAYYTAHMHKDRAGLDEDGILQSLDKDTVVVHDHNIINYNDDYEFQNAECCAHLLRDLKKVVDNLGHEWPKEMINLLVGANIDRLDGKYVDVEYTLLRYDTILSQGDLENFEDRNKYYSDDESTLIKRLREYKDNYLMWLMNAEIPFTNNESERSLRGSKTKMKVSGQFNNLNHARYFARIKSYIETGHRHGIGANYLISRALNDNAMTIEEIKSMDEED